MKFLNSYMIFAIIWDFFICIISFRYLADNFNYNDYDNSLWIPYQQFNASLAVSYFIPNNLYVLLLLLHILNVKIFHICKTSQICEIMPMTYCLLVLICLVDICGWYHQFVK